MPHGEYESLLRVVDRIYDAALDSTCWAQALDELTRFVGAIAADLYITHATDVPPFLAFTGISDVQASPEDKFTLDYDIASPDEIARSPYYQDLLFKNGYGLFIGANALNRGRELAGFGVHYEYKVDPYQSHHFERLKRILPHLRRTAQLQNRLKQSVARESRLAGVIDAMASGMVLLDSRAQITHINRAAERLLAKGNGVSIRARKLKIAHPDLDRKLARVIGDTIRQGRDLGRPGGTIRVDRPDGACALSIIVLPLPLHVHLEQELGAMLVISDLYARVADAALDITRKLFGLTHAEAELAVALANGETVNTYARRTGRSVDTVRDQLKSAMGKAGVNRQAALVRLILNTTGSL